MEGPQGRFIATREGRSKKTTAKKELAMGDFQKKGPEAPFLIFRMTYNNKHSFLLCYESES